MSVRHPDGVGSASHAANCCIYARSAARAVVELSVRPVGMSRRRKTRIVMGMRTRASA